MRSKMRFLNFFVLCMAVLFAKQSVSQPSSTSMAPGQSTRPADWDQLVDKANKEGKVILFGQSNNIYRKKLIAGFNKKYPKIKIEYRSGNKTADFVPKIAAERRAGLYEVDLVLTGSEGVRSQLIPAGYMMPIKDLLVLPELQDSSKWINGKLEYSDKEEKYVVAYAQFLGVELLVNTQLVDVSTLKSYDDLFKPEFAGKIVVAHPREVAQSRYSFGFFYSYYGDEFFKKLAVQKPAIVADVKQLIDWVAHGKSAIGISPGNPAAYQELVNAGVPLTGLVLKEGGYYSPGYNNLSFVKDAPHPNAAKVFANWILTKEGQEVVVDALGGSSVRTDVANPLKFDEGKKYYAPHLESNDATQDEAVRAFVKYVSK